MFVPKGYEYGSDGFIPKGETVVKSSGKEIEPHPEVSTEEDTVLNELGYNEVDKVMYSTLKRRKN